MSDTPTETLIRRIQKLLALAESPNENEAQAAAAKAQTLLAAHGLEMAEVNAHKAKSGTLAPESFEPRTRDDLRSSAMYSYQQQLMRSIASNNFCYYMLTERTKEDPRARNGVRVVKTHTLIGSHLNVTVATMLYEYLIQTMDRLLPWQGMEKRGKEALLWLAGCSDRLQERLQDIRLQQEQEQAEAAEKAKGDGRSLVTLREVRSTEADLNRDFLYGQKPGTTAANRAKWAAQRAAQEAEFAQSVATQTSRPIETIKPETAAQKRKREERQARQEKRWQEQSDRRFWKQYDRKRSAAYQAGSEAGNDIGLDKQIDKDAE